MSNSGDSHSVHAGARLKLALLILRVAAVTFLLRVLVSLVQEWIGRVRRRAQAKNMVRYRIGKKHEVVITLDSRRRIRSTRTVPVVGEDTPTLYDIENRARATGTRL